MMAAAVVMPAVAAMPFAVMVAAVAAVSFAVMAAAVAVMAFAMMVAGGASCKLKRTGQIGLYRLVGAAPYAALKLNARLGQGLLRPRPDAAADQRMHPLTGQQARQRAMAALARRQDAAGNDLLGLYLIKLEGLCMAKMLKNLSVIIGYCNNHLNPSFLIVIRVPVA